MYSLSRCNVFRGVTHVLVVSLSLLELVFLEINLNIVQEISSDHKDHFKLFAQVEVLQVLSLIFTSTPLEKEWIFNSSDSMTERNR